MCSHWTTIVSSSDSFSWLEGWGRQRISSSVAHLFSLCPCFGGGLTGLHDQFVDLSDLRGDRQERWWYLIRQDLCEEEVMGRRRRREGGGGQM